MNNSFNNDEENLFKKDIEKYMNSIKVPEDLGGRVMKNYQKIKKGSNKSNSKNSKIKYKVLAGAASVMIVAGIFLSVASKNDLLKNVTFIQPSNLKGNIVKQNVDKDIVYSEIDKEYKDKNGLAISYKLPVINLEGEEVENANKEIKEKYGKQEDYQYVKYDYYQNNDVLSLLIKSKKMPLAQWEAAEEYCVYNFDMETGKRIDNDKLTQIVGISKKDCNKYISNNVDVYYKNNVGLITKNLKDAYSKTMKLYSDFNEIKGSLYIGKDNKLFAVENYYETSDSFEPRIRQIIINASVNDELREVKTSSNTTQTKKNTTNTTKSISETETITYSSQDFKIKLPKSWDGKYNVEKGDSDKGRFYKFMAKSNNENLFEIRVERGKNSNIPQNASFIGNTSNGFYYIYVSDDSDSDMGKDVGNIMNNIFVKAVIKNYNQTESKVIYAKDMISLKGNNYKGKLYYISDENNLCVISYEDGINVEIIANYTSQLIYDEDKNVIEAYPIGSDFTNNIVTSAKEIVFKKN